MSPEKNRNTPEHLQNTQNTEHMAVAGEAPRGNASRLPCMRHGSTGRDRLAGTVIRARRRSTRASGRARARG